MRFWDSSAIIPLCLKEQTSETVRRLIKADGDIVVWWATKIECLSALARRRREGVLDPDAELKAMDVLFVLAAVWSEIQPSELLRQRTERVLSIHPLRSADSFQLAAALLWAQESPKGHQMVCLDRNLRQAAYKEGFTIIP